MTYANNINLSGIQGINASATGVEVPDSRRLVYFSDCSFARVTYAGGGLGNCAIGVSYSLDWGTTWTPLVPAGPTLGLAGTILLSEETDVSGLAWSGDMLVSAVAYGSTLLGLGLYSVRFIELHVR